jgi:hypothetical protein
VNRKEARVMDEEGKRRAIDALMGKPVQQELDESLRKMRVQLLVFCCAAFAIIHGAGIDTAKPVFGIQLKGLSPFAIEWALIAVTLYTAVHFAWTAWDGFQEWRLRVTGTRYGAWDVQRDPRQATLFRWWLANNQNLVDMEQVRVLFEKYIEEGRDFLKSARLDLTTNMPNVEVVRLQQIHENLQTHANGLMNHLNTSRQVCEDPYIHEALQRFDNAFFNFQRSQNIRWLLVEWGFPIVFALYVLAHLLSIVLAG